MVKSVEPIGQSETPVKAGKNVKKVKVKERSHTSVDHNQKDKPLKETKFSALGSLGGKFTSNYFANDQKQTLDTLISKLQ